MKLSLHFLGPICKEDDFWKSYMKSPFYFVKQQKGYTIERIQIHTSIDFNVCLKSMLLSVYSDTEIIYVWDTSLKRETSSKVFTFSQLNRL